MELVYLWVEKYKNIEYKGFNFSPKFECQYDKEMNTLTVNKGDDYINIFPSNINVSVIAGENGSGKSSILELLFARYNEEKIFFIYYDGEKKQLLVLGTKTNIETRVLDENLSNISFNTIECLPNTKAIYYSNILNKNDLYLQEFLVPITYTHTVNISTSHILSQMKLIETNLQNTWNKSTSGFDKIYRSFEVQQIQNALILIKSNVIQIPFELPDKLIIKNVNFKSFIDNAKNKFNNSNYRKILEVIEKNNDNKTIFKNYLSTNLVISLLLENINSNNPILEELLDIVLNQKMTNYLEDFYLNVKNKLYGYEFTIDGDKSQATYVNDFFDLADDILNQLDGIGEFDENSYSLKLDIKDTDFSFLQSYEKLIQQSEYFWDIGWRGLSSGEENYLYQFSRLYNLKNSFKNDPYKNLIFGQGIAKNLILLIDEGEVTLHPQWQKNYIKYLIEFLEKNFTQNIQLVLTTHSPFILSDIPKENITFLEKGGQAYPDVDTFAANIHTLLSHGFFMRNGLMGEFAKQRLEKILEYLTKKVDSINLSQEEIKYTIDLVGEELLKNKLETLYNEFYGIRTSEEQYLKRIAELEAILEDRNND